MNRTKTLAALIAATLLLAGCAIGPDYERPAAATLGTNATWQAPLPVLPHDGKSAALIDWWKSWNDPALSTLIEQSQRENTTIAQAMARIAQARASYDSLIGALMPSVTGNAYDTRSKGGQQAGFSSAGGKDSRRSEHASIDAAWELDLFGGGQRAREASRRRSDARLSDWHDARVSVSAEVATQYVNLRSCEVLLTGYEVDATSRAETARLTVLKRNAGFESPANAALAQASSAEAAARLTEQRANCDLLVKLLAELTAMPEPTLRELLAQNRARIPAPAPSGFGIIEIPAALLSQRPDLAAAEAELAAAMSDIGVAMAERLPRLRLTGSIGFLALSSPGVNSRMRDWSYGPALTLPIFDAGQRAAEVRLHRAKYDESLAAYKGRVLRAVREVEEALVRLDSAAKREADVLRALNGYEQFRAAAEARVKVGAGSLTELEEARRAVVLAQGSAVGVTRERLNNWIALYKAVGGGWRDANTSVATR